MGGNGADWGVSVGVGWRVGGWELGPGVGSGVVLDQGWEQGWGFGWGVLGEQPQAGPHSLTGGHQSMDMTHMMHAGMHLNAGQARAAGWHTQGAASSKMQPAHRLEESRQSECWWGTVRSQWR